MGPLTVLSGVLLESYPAVTVNPASVMWVVRLPGDDCLWLLHDFKPLLPNIATFLGMTIMSAASFYSHIINQ